MNGLKKQLIRKIAEDFKTNSVATGLPKLDSKIAIAIAKVPREEFVAGQYRYQSYRNTSLPIGYDQTISQPFMVALMTQLLAIKSGDKVLEIGTGSGYQAAILATLGFQTYSVEIVPELADSAKKRFARLGITVNCIQQNGYLGYPQQAPYKAILVCAAARIAPASLLEQLAIEGRLVIPIKQDDQEILTVFTRVSDNCYSKKALLDVRFVPFTAIPEHDLMIS